MIEFKDNLDYIKQKQNQIYTQLDNHELPIDIVELNYQHTDMIVYSKHDLALDNDLNKMKMFTDSIVYFFDKIL